ncbi:hypothetical protein QBC39DRAFT_351171 [Podospora conica]|nr:hypothetical protein QBC39DRAFT_351171 [Schizothecium conicum]
MMMFVRPTKVNMHIPTSANLPPYWSMRYPRHLRVRKIQPRGRTTTTAVFPGSGDPPARSRKCTSSCQGRPEGPHNCRSNPSSRCDESCRGQHGWKSEAGEVGTSGESGAIRPGPASEKNPWGHQARDSGRIGIVTLLHAGRSMSVRQWGRASVVMAQELEESRRVGKERNGPRMANSKIPRQLFEVVECDPMEGAKIESGTGGSRRRKEHQPPRPKSRIFSIH